MPNLLGRYSRSSRSDPCDNASGLVTHCNQRAAEGFGWAADKLPGSRSSVLLALRKRDAVAGALVEGIQNGQLSGDGPVRIKALQRDGHEFPIEVNWSRLDDGELAVF